MTGVLKYKEIHGDMSISRGFIIPRENPQWPETMWGMHLGSCLRDIKRGKCYADRKEEMMAIGYEFGTSWKGAFLIFTYVFNAF
jgi:hypothetical protein